MALLATIQNVKDRLTPNVSGTLPIPDATITDMLTQNQDAVLNAFGVIDGDETKLSTSRQSVAKSAIIARCVADCLVALFPTSESAERNAENMRKHAMEDIDRTLERAAGADKAHTRPGVSLT